MKNRLYYGDNLKVLREHVEAESVDLVYLDPPFKSDQDYNVLFAEQNGTRSAAQIHAFQDTWRWDEAAAAAYQEVVEAGGRVSLVMQGFRQAIGENDMLAYLAMMAPRLVELHRVLRPTGSIYLHCDPTANHYLKLLMDAVFGPANFLNEIIWKRTHAHGSSRRYGPLHDTILYCAKSGSYVWTNPRVRHDPDYIGKRFTHEDEQGRKFQPISLTGAGVRHGESGKPWQGIDPTHVGRHWALPKHVLRSLGLEEGSVQKKLDALDAAGLIYWPEKEGGTPRLKWYADRLEGAAIGDVWTDIPPISARSAERLGYPTQKPEPLLRRMIEASTREGDTVLDPFCGCGTTIAVAQQLNRRWLGIDITHLAISLIKHRLHHTFGEGIQEAYEVIGEPVDVHGARALADEDPYQFQYWALGLVDARPVEQRKGPDKGIDGRIFFHDSVESQETKQIVLSVKGGKLQVAHVRDLHGVVDREKAALGGLITMQEPTRAMRAEAASAGFYESPWGSRHPRLQILTVQDLLSGKRIDMPASRDLRTFKKAPKAKRNPGGGMKNLFLF